MDDFDKKVIDKKVKANQRLKAHYHYARSLGFSSAESTLIMNWSKDNILRKAAKDVKRPKDVTSMTEDCCADDSLAMKFAKALEANDFTLRYKSLKLNAFGIANIIRILHNGDVNADTKDKAKELNKQYFGGK